MVLTTSSKYQSYLKIKFKKKKIKKFQSNNNILASPEPGGDNRLTIASRIHFPVIQEDNYQNKNLKKAFLN